MSKKLKPKRLTKRQVQDLFSKGAWQKDPQISEILPFCEAYRDERGQVILIFSDGSIKLYDDGDSLISELTQTAHAKPQHLLQGRLLFERDFADKVPQLLEGLADRLNLNPQSLDKTEASLDLIDEAIQRIGKAKFLQADLFSQLVAYTGEVIRKQTGGKWEMRLAGQTWEPWILSADGRYHAPFSIVFRELQSSGKRSSIRGMVNGELRANRLG